MKYLLLLILLSGCAVPSITAGNVAADLQPFFVRFVQDIGVDVSGISGIFMLTMPNAVAYCDGFTIEVDPNWWSTANDFSREEAIFHELGHCAMHLSHIPGTTSDGCPVSIMNPIVFGNSPCYVNKRDYYFSELRNH